ncbi:Homeobox protein knotted-1-like 6 [Ananas comosus]|uniref:Homeobox protein knotted-1-like 6 n=1 Tax=Ananas comosus TaxID=4615 RepID=A0A199W4G2_ANACO|nr:Homeobox protein knotted-1-like 6 [Ananas comosus]
MYGMMMQRAAADDLHGLIAAAGAGGGGGGFRSAAAERDGGEGEEEEEDIMEEMEETAMGEVKARIASHPRYPTLLRAYIDCQKVGAPPEIASFLEEIRRENDAAAAARSAVSGRLLPGADPELDEFMVIIYHL